MLGYIIGAFVVIMIGVFLLPVITNEIKNSNNVNNVSSPITQTLINFVPVIFCLGIAVSALGLAVSALKNAGLLSNSDDEESDEPIEIEQKPKKQTYKEYVRERLQIESMLSYNPLRRWFG